MGPSASPKFRRLRPCAFLCLVLLLAIQVALLMTLTTGPHHAGADLSAAFLLLLPIFLYALLPALGAECRSPADVNPQTRRAPLRRNLFQIPPPYRA